MSLFRAFRCKMVMGKKSLNNQNFSFTPSPEHSILYYCILYIEMPKSYYSMYFANLIFYSLSPLL